MPPLIFDPRQGAREQFTSRLPAIFDYCLPPNQIVIPSIVSVDNIKQKRNKQSITVVSFLDFGHSDGSDLFEAKVCKLRYENTCNFSFLVFFFCVKREYK